MAKGENLSIGQNDSSGSAKGEGQLMRSSTDEMTATLDVRRAIEQRLESLRSSGLDAIPAGTGEHYFDFTSIASDSLSDSVASKAQSTEPAAAASVSEKKPDYASSVPSINAEDPVTADATASTSSTAASSKISTAEKYGAVSADKLNALNVIKTEVESCTRCDELCQNRTQTVFGVGTPETRLVFVGEGPGADEDRLGEPFVGAAGKLLDKIITACKLSREEVYILNTVKCRPPGNRNPSKEELANCWGYAERQLEVIQPEYICCLGSVAARTLLDTTQSLGRLRKQFHAYRGSRVLVTYHPAYLLRTPSAKKHVWEDMKMLMKEMGISL